MTATVDVSTFLTNDEIITAARRNLDDGPWAYLSGASESETTMRRNRAAFDRWAFRPRVLVDVSNIDTSVNFLGHNLRIPVILAPVGSLEAFDPEGALGSAKGAASFGTMQVVATGAKPSIEATMEAAPGPKVFQLYVNGDWDWCRDILTRAQKVGYMGVALTVDVAHYSRRERHVLTRWNATSLSGGTERKWRALVTWDDADRYKETTGLPFMVKGIQTAEDAAICVEHGVDVIWVSNHGGRQLDHALGTLDTLPEVVQAVRGRAKIVLDGGIQRGSDVLKAIALGADAVAIGKLQGWGLAAAGADGVRRVLEILEDEMKVAMGLLGVTSVGQLNQNYLTRAEPVTPPHEMSSWVNLAENRLV